MRPTSRPRSRSASRRRAISRRAIPASTSRSPGTRRTALNTALRTALPAGQGPDVFYLEPDQTEYITNGFIVPLDNLVNWNNIYDWARQVWTHDGKTWALPEEAYTDELYYNKDRLAKLGVALPASDQFDQAQFLDLVKKARAADMTPIAAGRGRPALSRRLYPRRGAAAQARPRRLRQAARTASSPSRIRASSPSSPGSSSWSTPAPIRRTS